MKSGTPRGPYKHWKRGHRINSIQKQFNVLVGKLSACDRTGDDPSDIIREIQKLMPPDDFRQFMTKRI